MIQVNRTPEPLVLTNNAIIWLTSYRNAVNAYIANPSIANRRRKNIEENRYRQAQIKEALIHMFSGKCAYCESQILHIDYGHIEHYRPKSLFPDECFNWENLLLGCSICNGPLFKGNQFPIAAQNGPLIDPTVEDPEHFLSFEFDANTGTANVFDKTPRGFTTKNLLGLNRPALVRHRSKAVRKMTFAALKASKGDADALVEIKKCCNADEEYSAFAIELCRHFNIT